MSVNRIAEIVGKTEPIMLPIFEASVEQNNRHATQRAILNQIPVESGDAPDLITRLKDRITQLEADLVIEVANSSRLVSVINDLNSPTHMGEPVLRNKRYESGDRAAYEGCREDLLKWKHRAQKAGAKNAELQAKLDAIYNAEPVAEVVSKDQVPLMQWKPLTDIYDIDLPANLIIKPTREGDKP
jgi:hypothetical protein